MIGFNGRKLNAAKNYPEYGVLEVPTLEEVLDKFVPNDELIFYFDIKSTEVVPLMLDVWLCFKVYCR